jgi:hypothetical protein
MKKSGILTLIASAGVVLALSGLAVQTPALAQPKPKTGGACFYGSNADGFSAANDRTVYVRAGIRDVYELKLFAPCIDVDWAQHIALRSRSGDFICEGNNVDVEVITPSPIGHQRCQVTSVHKLTEADVAAMPKKDRP